MSFITYTTGEVSWISIILVFAVLFLVPRFFFSGRKWTPKLPPFPSYRLPVLGHLWLIDLDMRKPFRKFHKQLGDVYSLWFGKQLVIVLSGYETLKDAFIKNADVFSNRPKLLVLERLSRGLGVANTNGDVWREHRRFSLMTLKDFGMGKSILEHKIHEEIKSLQDVIQSKHGSAFDPKDAIGISVSNIICSIIFGGQHIHGDSKFLKLMALFEENLRRTKFTAMTEFIPLLSKLPGDMFGMKKLVQNSDDIFEFINEILEDHIKKYDENKIEDFTSAYIKEMKRMELSKQITTFSYEQLAAVIGDFIIAGSETTATTLRWSIVCLVSYPEIQEQMFSEISEHVGTERLPSVQDRPNLTFIDAFYMEVLRFCSLTIDGPGRATTNDFEFKGYTIPKGAIIMPDFDSVNTDASVWGDPDNFRPQRFLNDDGKLMKIEEFIPFSVGKRSCIGESLAKMELFLFISSLVQKFQFLCPSEYDVSIGTIDGEFGIVHAPKPYQIIAKLR